MSERWFDKGRRNNGLGPTALVVVAVALVAVTLGCCNECPPQPPQPATHAMAFGARTAGCDDDCLCVCPVPETVTVEQGDKVWFINTSEFEIKITTQAGTFEAGDVVAIAAKDAVLVTVKDDATVGDFDLFMTVGSPGLPCPGLASPRIIVDQKSSSS